MICKLQNFWKYSHVYMISRITQVSLIKHEKVSNLNTYCEHKIVPHL